jgi:hypothetical protein
MSPKDVTGKYAVRNCDEANTEQKYKTRASENFFHNSK